MARSSSVMWRVSWLYLFCYSQPARPYISITMPPFHVPHKEIAQLFPLTSSVSLCIFHD